MTTRTLLRATPADDPAGLEVERSAQLYETPMRSSESFESFNRKSDVFDDRHISAGLAYWRVHERRRRLAQSAAQDSDRFLRSH
eukprot:CAMPEP_0174705994 /NCGR_PEP_ID=MMETSP1094-20130205/9008_1 /TAXON_ID=156173 /ORGANISM="Chrysochromulina brevifilum, Strain UTEX LB 985" /LENGTH=83 /DNA_ID=CAMNT_0015904219 /DNA_START=615 /DNA_END=864 /DNA_ORIENTATION=-